MQLKILFDKLFARGGRDGIILIFSLLLAFFMWSIQKLSQDYSAYIEYKVSATSTLEGRVQSAVSNDILVVRGKSSGFYILQQRYGNEANVLEISVEPKQLNKVYNSSDKFYLRSSNIKTNIQEALGDDFQLESFTTDTLYFNFPRQSYKKVPISVRHSIKYKTQYMPFSPIVLKPDSVLIYGQTLELNKIDSVYTNTIKGDNLESPISGLVQISPIDGVTFSSKDIYYSQEIGRYVENSINIKVVMMNVPAEKNVAIIPQEVKLKYRTPFSGKGGYSASDFLIVADYLDIESKGNIVQPMLQRVPKDIYSIQVDPKFVECIAN